MAAPYTRVTFVDGRTEVVRIGPKTQVCFERHFSITMFEYTRKRSMEQVYWLPWHALTEAGKETRGFDDWLTVVDDIEANVVDTPANPVGDLAVNPEPDPSLKAQPAATS